MRSNKILLAAGLVAIATLAGCAAPDGGTPSPPSDTITGPQEPRDELRVLASTRNESIDPLIASSVSEIQVVRLVGGTLFTLDDDGQGVGPGLASGGEFNEDATEYVLTLEEGLVFSDGSPLTAHDVVATFERGLSSELNAYIGEFAPVAGASATSDTTVEFVFNRPFPSFETMVSFPEFSILKASEIGADGTIPEAPTLAGAYIVEGDALGSSYSLVANPDYHGAKPSVARLEFSVVPDSAGRLAQVQGGEADFAVSVGAQSLGRDVSPATIHVTPVNIVTQLTFSNGTEPLTDPSVRRAISAALDRETISKLAWGGQVEPNAGLQPTSSAGAAPGNPNADVDAARELLQGTACEDGCTLSLLLDASEEWQTASATVVQQNLKAIGIEVETEPLETVTMYSRLGEGDFDMAIGYFGAYADLPDTLASYCMSYEYGFLSCYTGYQSDSAEAVIGRAITTTDEEELAATYDELNSIFVEDAPLATLTDYAFVWAIGEDAAGYAWIGANTFLTIAPAA